LKLSPSERVFHDVYAPALNYAVGPKGPYGVRFKPCSFMLVSIFGLLGFYLVGEAVGLDTPDEQEQWFPADHMSTGLADLMRNEYMAGEDDMYMRGDVYFGLGTVDYTGFSKWTPSDRGTHAFDQTFDLGDAEAQDALVQLCDELEVEDCIPPDSTEPLAVCSRVPFTLLSESTLKCFLRTWKTELEAAGGALPTGDGFALALSNWLDTATGSRFAGDVGFVDGRVGFVRLRFRWSAQVGLPVKQQRLLYDRSKLFLTARTLPATLGDPFFHEGTLGWMETSEELVQVVLSGFTIVFPCAFVILLFSTGSVLASAYATLTVALITGSLLGGVKAAFGFALGIGEAIAANMVIGLSIDYTLHLSHAYMHAKADDRDGKLKEAATTMGVTVIAGAFTTFTSALFMVPCQLTFFIRMCTLMGGTVGFSILYALFFFMPLMALVGPSGPQQPLIPRIRGWLSGGGGGGVRAAREVDEASATATSEA